jgi:hypothetical protein
LFLGSERAAFGFLNKLGDLFFVGGVFIPHGWCEGNKKIAVSAVREFGFDIRFATA